MTVTEPRAGIVGYWDRFIGPGATRAEQSLIIAAALTGALAQWIHSVRIQPDASIWLHLLAAVLMFDILGGVIANATASARRWYHRPGQGARHHLGFIALHGLHLALVAALYRGGDWSWFAMAYAAVLCGATAVVALPAYLKRPMALLLVSAVVIADTFWLAPTPLLPWFLPLLFLKLLYSHLVPD